MVDQAVPNIFPEGDDSIAPEGDNDGSVSCVLRDAEAVLRSSSEIALELKGGSIGGDDNI